LTAGGPIGKRLRDGDQIFIAMIGRNDPRGYYATLGLPLTASPEDIRRAFGEQARRLHPDHAPNGGDPAAFQRLVEAYDVLRDPSRRLRYDADSVMMSRHDPADTVEAAVPDPLAGMWTAETLWPSGLVRRSGGPDARWLTILCILVVMTLAALGWAWIEHGERNDREERLAALTVELERARSDQAELLGRYRAVNVLPLEQGGPDGDRAQGPARFFSADVTFPPGSAGLGPDVDAQLVEAVKEASSVVQQFPPDRRWVVLIQGQAPHAAGADGVDVASWQLSLTRISQVVDRLVQAGFPPDRIAIGFAAGFMDEAPAGDPARVVELRVVCCLR
jgi:outer membrane protein OmpA-like peptidoglycan-associated protein